MLGFIRIQQDVSQSFIACVSCAERGFFPMIRIRKGLNLPIKGSPKQQIFDGNKITKVALNGRDYVGMKPTMAVKVGEQVKLGQLLFTCKKNEGLRFTSPASGKVVAVNRGERRTFQNVVIEIEGDGLDQVEFQSFKGLAPSEYSFESLLEVLQESGLWNVMRTRPFDKSAPVDGARPHSLFINCADTNPLAMDPDLAIQEDRDAFIAAVEALSKIPEEKTYVCGGGNSYLPKVEAENVHYELFEGPHPAGNVGTHIHFLAPVGPKRTAWHLNYLDAIQIGKFLLSGKLDVSRLVSLAGPRVKDPRVVRTRIGACVDEIAHGQVKDGPVRLISGSILNGSKMEAPQCYLGRFDKQVSVLEEDKKRELLGWHMPGFDRFSLKKAVFSGFIPGLKFDMTTTTYGSPRAMVPVGSFEKVMPLDILPTQLLRAVASHDTDYAQQLGVLELVEEDIALCTFASPGKTDFGPMLRATLEIIEKEG